MYMEHVEKMVYIYWAGEDLELARINFIPSPMSHVI